MSKKDRKKFASLAEKEFGDEAARMILESKRVEIAKIRHKNVETLILVNGVPSFFFLEEDIYPSLLLIYKLRVVPEIPIVYVDKGAVPYILNGADVMAPGITRVSEGFGENRKVLIADEKERVFAVGKALMSSEKILKERRGKAIKNIHYAGDGLWKIFLEL